jgi:hypothetical protein
LDKYTIAHSNFSVISCHAPWMMLANIGINQSAVFAIFSIDNSALPISVSASRRLTSKASKLAQIKPSAIAFVVSRTPSTGYVISAL